MDTLRRIVLVVAFAIGLPICAPGQPRNVRVQVAGELQVYDTTGSICEDARHETTLRFVSLSGGLSFDGQARAIDFNCVWLGTGTLSAEEAQLELRAQFRDFVQFQPQQPLSIRAAGPAELIRIDGIRVVLYSRERNRDELRALANRAVDAGDLTRAIELFDMAIESVPDPKTLSLKADALDQADRHAEAAATWNQTLGAVSNQPTLERRFARLLPWHWATSLYRAVDASDASGRNAWLNVARVSQIALGLEEPTPTTRSQLMGTWLDSLFKAAKNEGGYSELSEAISTDEDIGRSWDSLYYEEFREQVPADISSRDHEQTIEQLKELAGVLGR